MIVDTAKIVGTKIPDASQPTHFPAKIAEWPPCLQSRSEFASVSLPIPWHIGLRLDNGWIPFIGLEMLAPR
jgi:hypothetical protein